LQNKNREEFPVETGYFLLLERASNSPDVGELYLTGKTSLAVTKYCSPL
jgi:hypothetical protein